MNVSKRTTVLAIVAVLGIAAVGAMNPTPSAPVRSDAERAADSKIEIAKTMVRLQLKDADSAKFSGVGIGRSGFVCGMVNARNSFGAMAGNVNFYAVGPLVVVNPRTGEQIKMWNSNCVGQK